MAENTYQVKIIGDGWHIDGHVTASNADDLSKKIKDLKDEHHPGEAPIDLNVKKVAAPAPVEKEPEPEKKEEPAVGPAVEPTPNTPADETPAAGPVNTSTDINEEVK